MILANNTLMFKLVIEKYKKKIKIDKSLYLWRAVFGAFIGECL